MATESPAVSEVHQAVACLGRLTEAFRRRREALAASVGLTEHQWGVLEEISSEHFMPSMFARTRASTPAAVSKTLRQLIDKGLVSVSLSKSDGRQRDYVLTIKARKTLTALRLERERAIERIWMPLDGAAMRRFVEFGNLLAERLDRYMTENKE